MVVRSNHHERHVRQKHRKNEKKRHPSFAIMSLMAHGSVAVTLYQREVDTTTRFGWLEDIKSAISERKEGRDQILAATDDRWRKRKGSPSPSWCFFPRLKPYSSQASSMAEFLSRRTTRNTTTTTTTVRIDIPMPSRMSGRNAMAILERKC